MQQAGDETNKFEPYVLVLTYESAKWLTENDPNGKGKGVLELRYKDADRYRGNYSLFLQVTEVT